MDLLSFRKIRLVIFLSSIFYVGNIIGLCVAQASQFKEITLDSNPLYSSPRTKIKSFLVENHYVTANDNEETKSGGYGTVYLYKNIAAKFFCPRNDANVLESIQSNQLRMKALLKNNHLPDWNFCFPNEIVKVTYKDPYRNLFSFLYNNQLNSPKPDTGFLQIMPRVKGKTIFDFFYGQRPYNKGKALDVLSRLGSSLGKAQKTFLTKTGEEFSTYCHHDFHIGNIMMEDKTSKFHLIDLDFLSRNHPLVDPVFFLLRLHSFDGPYTEEINNHWDERLYYTTKFLVPYLKQFDVNTRRDLISKLSQGRQHMLSCYNNKNVFCGLPDRRDGQQDFFNTQFDRMLQDFCDYLALPSFKKKEEATLKKLPSRYGRYSSFHKQILELIYDLHKPVLPVANNNSPIVKAIPVPAKNVVAAVNKVPAKAAPAPVNKNVPVKKAIAPVKALAPAKNVAPVKKAPAKVAAAPAKKAIIPVKKAIAAVKVAAPAPAKNVVAAINKVPAKAAPAPVNKNVPVKKAIVPVKKAIAAVKAAAPAPAKNVVAAVNKALAKAAPAPVNKNVPVKKAIAPVKALAPAKVAAAPAKKAIIPVKKAIAAVKAAAPAPAKNVVAAINKVPAKAAPAPVNKNVPVKKAPLAANGINKKAFAVKVR